MSSYDERLLIAIRVCRKAENTARALRFVLIGAEARRTSESTRSLLASYPKLTARYAKETASRLILSDPKEIEHHGPLIFHSIAEDARKGDKVGYRVGWRLLQAWWVARRDVYKSEFEKHGYEDPWPIKLDDFASIVYGSAVLMGPDAAITELKRFRQMKFAINVGKKFVTRLLTEGRFELAEEIAMRFHPWKAVFLLVPLALAGRNIDLHRLGRGLSALKRRFRLDIELANYDDEYRTGEYVLDTVLTASEILIGNGVCTDVGKNILSSFTDPSLRNLEQRHEFEISLIDAIFRSYSLTELMLDKDITSSDIFQFEPQSSGIENYTDRHSIHHDRDFGEFINTISPFYILRAKTILSAQCNKSFDLCIDEFKKGFDTDFWRLSHRRRGKEYRAVLCDRLTTLIAFGASSQEIYSYAIMYLEKGEYPTNNFYERFAVFRELHSNIVDSILSTANATISERCGSEEKAHNLSELAELLTSFSPRDADALFQEAIIIASQLDKESIDQIRLFHSLIGHCKTVIPKEKHRFYASRLSEIIFDAGIRLKDLEDFPWCNAMESISLLDIPTALASTARWNDFNLQGIDTILPPVISEGLRTNDLDSTQASALLCLLRYARLETLEGIFKKALDEGKSVASNLAEEFAQDCLVGRIRFFEDFASLISKHGTGEWINKLDKQNEFIVRISQDEEESSNTTEVTLKNSEIIEKHVWEHATLTDSDRLLAEAEHLISKSRSEGEHISLRDVFFYASQKVPVGNLCEYLDALVGILEKNRDYQILDAILGSAQCWKSKWSVQNWSKNNIPKLISDFLPLFTRHIPWEDRLNPAIELAQMDGEKTQISLLKGIESSALELSVLEILTIANLISINSDPGESANLFEWYLERLFNRIPENEREDVDDVDIPVDVTSSVARFLYAHLSDVDLRTRWRAAHAMRRLARLGDSNTLTEIVNQYERIEEKGFRAVGTPFYWLAARLWLMISLDRISHETPELSKPFIEKLLNIALSDDFPHMLIRAYATDACLKLSENGYVQLDSTNIGALQRINSPSNIDKSSRVGRTESFESCGISDDSRRFEFDWMDTLRYWYEPWLNIFPELTTRRFLELSEAWIVDRWGITEQSKRTRYDPRSWRFQDSTYGSWSNSHGSLPTLERFQNHLEWHSMWCTAGELAKSYSVRKEEYEEVDELAMKIAQGKLSIDSLWLSDLIGAVPLQQHRWIPEADELSSWMNTITDDAFFRELFPEDRWDWIVANAELNSVYRDREERVQINTGLVSPETAHALVRALQTTKSQYLYFIPPENSESEINEADYSLSGWLSNIDGDTRFDSKDPYCHNINLPRGLPGEGIVSCLDLQQRTSLPSINWFREDSEMPSVIYETWGDSDRNGTYQYRPKNAVEYFGYRTLIRKDEMVKFMRIKEEDLIVQVGVTRYDKPREEPRYDTEGRNRAIFDRVFVLRREGDIESAERSFEAWFQNRQ